MPPPLVSNGKRKEHLIARLNLASDPFRNRALPWTVAVAVASVSLLALVFIVAQYRAVSAEADTSERQVRALRAQQAGFEKQANEIKQNITPEQFKTLQAAHALVSSKSFSWSQLFSDLEEFLPTDVRVSRISVREVTQVGDQTQATLDLTVMGKSPTDVTGMISEMNRAGTFNAVPLSESQKTGRGEAGYEWTLRVSYVQRVKRRAAGQVGAASKPSLRADGADAGGRE